jgi:choline transport protein
MTEQERAKNGVTPLKTKGEIDVVRLEAALGHKQELKRNFGLWSLTSLGVVIAKCVDDL